MSIMRATSTTKTTPTRPRGRRPTRFALAAAALVAVMASAGCAYNPPGAVWVPGTYQVDLWASTIGYPQGHAPVGKVAVCVDEPTAIGFSGGYQTTITWAGTTYITSPTPVLGPGCGELRVIVDCCYVPNYVTVTLTKE